MDGESKSRPSRRASTTRLARRIEAADRGSESLNIVLVDGCESSASALGRSLSKSGCSVWLADDFLVARSLVAVGQVTHAVSELRVAGGSFIEFLADVSSVMPPSRCVIVTAYPSIATAVQMTRHGVAGYFAKPATAPFVLGAMTQEWTRDSDPRLSDLDWPSLDRTIWEYLNQVLASLGSVSAAARRLGLDRRSLRRMLSKYPPAR